ncbi:MAG: M10 family metallopeptidase C-terminal domain-containing protein [Scytonema sp. PMC 1069.18]|nr:M10 family metallopeptidase C-terminal domain-containing protein [Scytonema sp. PMC 1069.18]MEC4883312.1 M10 family metallopeptidase C-terminal domain-containing protein [Scytonema sp. PMC 1070.18]
MLNSPANAERDIITDFVPGLDKIDLSPIDADLTLSGNQAFTFIGNANFNGSGAQVRFFTSNANLFVQAEINGDGNITADLEIELLGITTISAIDFIL